MARRIQLEIVGESRSAERAFKRVGKAADNFGRKMSRLSKKGLFGGRAGNVVRKAGVGGLLGGAGVAGAGIVGGVAAVKSFAAFEKTMARVQGLAGQSQKQVAAWSNDLIGMGPALGKSPQELAEALYFIASSGVPAGKAISVLAASAKASAAGLGETEVVADAVTSVMNAYASSGMGAARATDVLVATVREGKGEATEFAGVIGNVAAFASRLNVPFEEVGAALAAMTQLGTGPEMAATQLQAFFSSVLKVTPKARKAAAKVGFSFDVLAETLQKKGLLAALDMIKVGFKGNTQAMAQAFPNIRALRALLALTADDGGKVAGVFQRMSQSGGSLGAAWQAAQKTSSHHMAMLGASVEALKIAFGQGLAPVVSEMAVALGRKFADPAFVQRVRDLGFLIGTKLRDAFVAISAWFETHWPGIKQGFISAGNFAKRLHGWVQKISSVVPGGAGTLVGLIMGGILLSKLRGLAGIALLLLRRLRLIGAAQTANLLAAGGGGKGKGKGKGGLPLMGPWGPALVGAAVLSAGGASGARTGAYQPGMFKFVDALLSRMNAGGKLRAPEKRLLGGFGNRSISELTGSQLNWLNNRLGDIVINIDGREVARVTTPHQQRKARTQSSSRRGGRNAGANLGIG